MSKPFVKWVGGKTQLLGALGDIFPVHIGTYYEPFLGGGAVFFWLAAQRRFERAILNDRNAALVETYRVVQDSPEALWERLHALEAQYRVAPESTYRAWVVQEPSDPLSVAARFIALNKTGFNGLYRVNQKGRYNVPWGHKPSVRLADPDNLLACSKSLGGVKILSGDFHDSLVGAGPGDLIYLDPPYVPLSPTASFTSYTSDTWDLAAHQRVSEVARHYADLGCCVVVSNHDTPLVREIYHDFTATVVKVRRAINRDGSKRGPIGEVILTRNLASIE